MQCLKDQLEKHANQKWITGTMTARQRIVSHSPSMDVTGTRTDSGPKRSADILVGGDL